MLKRSIHDPAAFAWLMRWAVTVLTVLMLAGWVVLRLPGMRLESVAESGSWVTQRFGLRELFTATSAVSGVGLTSVVLPGYFSSQGLWIIVLLMQVGSLLTATVGAAIAMRLRERWFVAPSSPEVAPVKKKAGKEASPPSQPSYGPSIGVIFIRVTALMLSLELLFVVGTIGLWPSPIVNEQEVTDKQPHEFGPVEHDAFHAVSVVGQNGLSSLPHGLQEQWLSRSTHLVILPLMLLSSLGYPVLEEVWRRVTGKVKHFSPWSRSVLATTAVLYILGVLTITGAQTKPHVDAWLHPQTEGRKAPGKADALMIGKYVAESSYLTVSARSAGLEGPDLEAMEPAGRWTLIGLMAAGGAAWGSVGGIGVVCLAVLAAAAVGAGRGEDSPRLFGYQVTRAAVNGSLTAIGAFIGLVVVSVFVLSLSESPDLGKLLFDVVSAAGGNGLTRGTSTELMTSMGLVVMIATMWVGKVGMLALAARIAQ